MTITGIIVMLVVGTVVGSLGRLVVPARQPIPIWLTTVVGVVAAFSGSWLARSLGVPAATNGIDWVELLVQVMVAAGCVVAVANLYVRRGVRVQPAAPRRSVRESPPVPERPRRSPQRPPSPLGDQPRPASTTVPSRIFISYRRTDSRYAARGISDRLRGHFGRAEVFMDVDSLPVGADFVDGVFHAIRASAVVLVLIGDGWLSAQDDRGRRRLHEPADNVRTEIEQALRWGKPVLPVLLDDADMPRPDELPASIAIVSRLNGIRLDHESWDADVDALIQAVTRLRSQ